MSRSYLDKENQHILTHTKDNRVNSFIANVNELVRHVDGILYSNTIFNQEVVDVLREALETDFTELLKDLKKGNHLGNRQLDINLLKNMSKWNEYLTEEEQINIWLDKDELVYYDSALVKFIDGTTHRIIFQFDGVEGPITTHGDLLLQLNNDEEFLAKLEKTLANTFPAKVVGEYLKFYDKLGENSNIEGIELNAVSGKYKEKNPYYYWIATTSALQVLAMRSTEIIKLGAHIDKVVSLALNVDQMLELQKRVPQLVDTYNEEDNPKGDVTIYNHLTELLEIYSKLDYLLDVINLAEAAENSANMAEQFADEALTHLNKIQSIKVGRTLTLAPSQSAEVQYDGQSNTFSFYIPQGVKGERGEPFQVNASGTLEQKTLYDDRPEGFGYLDVEAGNIFFKKSNIHADWTEGLPFGKGDKGEKGTSIEYIEFTSTTHKSGLPHQFDAIDTYTITLDNGITEDFKIQNGTSTVWSEDGAPYPINYMVYHNGKQWLALRANSVEPDEGEDWSAIGTAATANLTTSNIDGTVGRVLKVGDGGWMGQGLITTEALGYPASNNDITNQTKVIRSQVNDNGVAPFVAGIHFSSAGTWGRLRVAYKAPAAWIQGGNAPEGTGWTSQVVLSSNLLQTTGTSTDFPMSQKAVTDALNGVSDMRDKKDSQEFGIGLELIEELDVIKYKLNKRDWYRAQEAKQTKIVTQDDADGNETTEEVEEVDADILAKPLTDYDANDGSLARDDYYTGMSAQAVKAKLDELGMSDFGLVKKYDEEYEGGEDRYYIEQLGLLPFLINSVKQLSAQNKALVERVELLEGKR